MRGAGGLEGLGGAVVRLCFAWVVSQEICVLGGKGVVRVEHWVVCVVSMMCVAVCVCSLGCLSHVYMVCGGHAPDGIMMSGMNGLGVCSRSGFSVGFVGVILLGIVWMA